MIDTTLINALKVMANKEKKIKEFKRRLRIKGKITAKGITKKGNITLKVEKEGEEYTFTIIKSHKERYALAEKLEIGKSVSVEGIPKFRITICTRLKALDKSTSDGKQAKLDGFK
jgi:hypothetical protein